MKPPSQLTGSSEVPVTIPRDEIALLELNTRKGRRGVGAIIGLTAGAAVGMVLGFAAGDDPEPPEGAFIFFPVDPEFSAGEKAAILALILAPVGMALGALVAPGAKWWAIPAGRIQLGFDGSVGDSGGIEITLRF